MNAKATVEGTRQMAASLPLTEAEYEQQPKLRFRSDQPEGFGGLLLARRRTLVAYANMLTGNRAAADDLVQDTFERALRAQGQFRAGTNLTAWLRRIMRNLFTDRCRQGTRFISMSGQDFSEQLATETPPDDPREVDLCEFVTLADVEAALGSIEPSAREIFALAHVQRQSYQKIATDLGIPVSTVGTRLWRVRARIRDILGRSASQLQLQAGSNASRMMDEGGRA